MRNQEQTFGLLHEQLIRTLERPTSLPEILASLSTGDAVDFPALRPHQLHPWHAFLVQLAALVVARSGDATLERSSDAWCDGLLKLAGEAGEDAWTLLVDDPARPAFLQSPVSEGEWGRYKNTAKTPDDLDMLVTAKNHDVKHHLAVDARPEHWIYALVTLQTFQGFSGRGNYGIGRMNSGFGSRPGIAAAPDLDWSRRFRRDIRVWLEERERLLGPAFDYDPAGTSLLWTLPWDGRTSRSLESCDPFFVEICRRVRLASPHGRIVARLAPSDAAFLDAKERCGATGDIWTPTKIASTDDGIAASALTVSPQGLTYRLLQDVLFGGYESKPALEIRDEDRPAPVLIAQVMVRGQGRTDGYHERHIPLPPRAVGWLRSRDERAALGELARRRVERAATAQRRVLHPALCVLLQGAPDSLNLRDDQSAPWLARVDREVDRCFFDDLWRDFAEDGHTQDERWDSRLYRLCRRQLEEAIESAPIPKARDYRAIVSAESVLFGSARKHLEHATDFQPTPGEEPGRQEVNDGDGDTTPA